MTIAAVVLAAGFSRRLGRAKQDAVLGGRTLLRRATETALEAGFAPVLVVTRPPVDEAGGQAREQTGFQAGFQNGGVPGVYEVHNAEADEGMASSVRSGVRAAQAHGAEGLLLMTCDQPLLTAAHLQRLVSQPDRVTASGYAGRPGVPAYFPMASLGALLALRGDTGARGLLRDAAVVVNEDLALDIDTEEDLRRAESLLGARSPGPGER